MGCSPRPRGVGRDGVDNQAEGQVEVVQDHHARGPQVLRRLEQGAYFGEIGLLHNVQRTATVRVSCQVASTVSRCRWALLSSARCWRCS